MNERLSRPLVLEQLEERIFLDANPLAAAADGMAGHAEPVETAAVEHADTTASADQQTATATPPQPADEKPDNKADSEAQASATAGNTAAPAAPAQPATQATEQGDAHSTETQAQTTSPTAGSTSVATATADAPDHPAGTTTSAPEEATTTSTAAGADHQVTDTSVHPAVTSAGQSPVAAEATHQGITSADEHASTDSASESATAQKATAETPADKHLTIDTATDSTAAHLASGTGLGEPTDLTSTGSEAIDPMIGEDFSFTVTFDNQSASTVYGPYIDLVLDRGLEGTEPTDGSWDDGISFVGAQYLGQDVQSFAQLVDSTGSVTHHWAIDAAGDPLRITGLKPGDQFVTLLLPFGSFTPDQTPADIVVTAHMSNNADVGTALNVDVVSGAMYGRTPLNDPGTDPPLRGPANGSGLAEQNIKFLPEVIAFNTDIRVANVRSDCQQQHDPPDDTRNIEVNHQEIPTGPNFPGEYISTIDIAAGQTVGGPTGGGFIYTQHIPDNVFYTGNISVKDSSNNDLAYTVSQQPTGSSGGDLVLTLNSPTLGTAASNDVVITYGFYVPETSGNGSAVINATTGDDTHVINNGEIAYTWTPIDSAHDATVIGTVNAEVDEDGNFSDNADVDDISHAQSIALQKSHELTTDNKYPGYTPGDILTYTIDFQVSDYFSFGDADPTDDVYSFRIDDTIANGLLLSSGPTIEIWEKGISLGSVSLTAGAVGSGMWTTTGTNGDVVVHYNLQAILAGLPGDDILDGGYTSATGTDHGATVGKITYQATIQREYAPGYVYPTDPNTGLPLTENNIDQGDTLSGGATIIGDIFQRDASGTAGSFTGSSEDDGSCDSLTIVTGDVMKYIYAINGVRWDASSGSPHIKPGDTVSYRLTYNMPISSTENFHLNDYLPLPVFNAADPDLDGNVYGSVTEPSGGWNQITNPNLDSDPDNNNTGFDTDLANFDAGDWFFTSSHTYKGPFDTASVDVGNNALDLHWLSYHDTNESPGKIDLVFTVKVSDAPFTDGLFLTNQVTATENGTMLSDSTTNAIAQVVLDQPVLEITKGVVESSDAGSDGTWGTADDGNPGVFTDGYWVGHVSEPGTTGFRFDGTVDSLALASHPVNANLSSIDAGDVVTFAIVVKNSGHSGAYDIDLSDTLPAGFDIPTSTSGLNLSVTNGAGTALTYTLTGSFPSGSIKITDDSDGALAGVNGVAGTNVLVITYDLVANSSVQPLQQLVNTATITNYAGAESGQDHTTTDLSDTATVTAAALEVTKAISGTGETSTDGTNVVIGETVTYTVTITVPEGTSQGVNLTDTLDNGLALVSLDSITPSSGLGTDISGSWASVLANATVTNSGGQFLLNFGTLTNTDINNNQPETITITYTAVVLNTSGNQQGVGLNNDVHVGWTENSHAHEVSANAPNVVVQEAQLRVVKDVSNNGGATWVDNGQFDQNDPISYRITLQHSATSREDAFDVLFTDTLPTTIDWSGATLSSTTGTAPTSSSFSGGILNASWDQLSYTNSTTSQYTTFIITGGVLSSATAGQTITNTGLVTWESLASDLTTPKSPYNTASYERTGNPADPGGAANDYRASDPATITVAGTIDKLQPTPAQYTIGDLVTYDIVVTLPEGTTNNLVVTDALPSGLQYQSSELVTLLANSNGHLTADFNYTGTNLAAAVAPAAPGDGTDISWNITTGSTNTVVVAADNQAINNSFLIRVTALVTNNPASHGDPDGAGPGIATILVNHASMTYTGGSATDGTDPTVTVIEPQISTTKSVTDTDTDPATAIAEPGEILTYTVRFTNSGTSTAYEVTAEDTLPAGVQYNAGSATITASSGLTSALDVTGAYNTAAQTINFTSSDGGWDISVGGWVEVQYTVTVLAAGFTTGSYVNTVDADWSNQNGSTNPNERIYDDGVSSGGTPYLVDGTQDQAQATFTVITTGSIGNQVFFDALGDGGIFNAGQGDVGISGVRVTLTADVDGDGTPEYTQTVLTNNLGEYTFANLAAFNNYVITVDNDGGTGIGGTAFNLDGTGYSPTYDLNGTGTPHTVSGVSLSAGQNRTDVDFGYTGQNSVGDTVWYDVNGNGVQDGNESGIAGLTVTISADIDGDGTFEYTATDITDGNGVYSFDHLPAGSFIVTVTPPASSVPTYDRDSGLTNPNNNTPFTLGANEDRDDIDFGLRGTAELGNLVWEDLNGNGRQDLGEAGIDGVTVDLFFAGADDVFQASELLTPFLTTTTAGGGNYLFDNLAGGIYTIRFGNNDGTTTYVRTVPNSTVANDLTDSDADIATGFTGNYYTLDYDDINTTVDAGLYRPVSLGDRVYFDFNGDGLQNAGEPGIPGASVEVVWLGPDGVLGGGDDQTFTTTTGTNGLWSVTALPPGNFQVTATPTVGSGFSVLTDSLDNGVLSATNPVTVSTNSGVNRIDIDFGFRGIASLGNRVYIDANGDGIQDSNGLEPGLPGVTVTLRLDANGDGDYSDPEDGLFTTVTDTSGAYLFANLPPGNYQVSASASGGSGGVPDNMTLTDSVDNGILNPATTVSTTLTTGQYQQTMDFGYQGNSSIGDTVWYDADGNGAQNTGATFEPGIPGVTVTLVWGGPDGILGNGDDVTFTTTTDANGKYLFSGLPVNGPDDPYRVTVTPSPAYPNQTYDSDGIGTANQSTLDLLPNIPNEVQDFGYRGTTTSTAQLGNFVWEDLNGNGRQDASETGLGGVTVDLFFAGADGVFQSSELATPVLTTFTAGDGSYLFDSLAAGIYRLRFGNTDGSTTYAWTSQDSPVATDATDSDASASNGFSGEYFLSLGESNTTVDAGLYRPVSLGDRIFFDYDGDGVQDTGEPGIPNIPVEVIWLGPDGLLGTGDDQTFTTTTGTDGHWSIDDLPPGSYQVTATPPAGAGYTITDSLDNSSLDPTSQVTISTVSGVDRTDIDFGFRGTGSVGDTIWNDRNGNGVQDPGEPGIGGVTVTIGVDLNGDGTPDFTTSATTDGNGQYLFDHLPAGSHTLRVDPSTLPPGIRPSYDPDGTLDNTFTVRLGAGENNRDVDFGYHFPPPKSPVPGTPVTPVQPSPVPETNELIADAFFMHREFGEASNFGMERWFPFDRWMEITHPQPPLPVSPIYTGIAEPGTTLALAIYDASGNLVGNQTIMADTGGNWLASFPGVLLQEMPHDMKVEQRISLYNESTAGLFNMRTYFNPNSTSLVKTSVTMDVDSMFDYLPSTIMDSVHSSLYSGFNIRWNNFNGYEFFATSINPAETGR